MRPAQNLIEPIREKMRKDGIGSPMPVVIDIWGGHRDMDHLARFLRHWTEDAQKLVSRELANGFLVNVRREVAWGDEMEFDHRSSNQVGFN